MIQYGLDARLEPGKTAAYGVQHMVLFIANSAIMPVIIAKSLGLGNAEISEMLLRTFFLCGVLSILQTRFGHLYPIIDGPSGLWLTVWINLAAITSAMGGDLAGLRAHLELGMVIAGAFLICLGFSGRMKYIAKLFSPLVNGIFLVLMPIQLSKSFIQGMLGTVYGGSEIDKSSLAAFWITVAAMILINIFGSPFVKSIAILIAIAAGWIFAVAVGIGDFGDMSGLKSFIILPEIFPWGTPAIDPGILITCILGSFLLFANHIGSMFGMADVLEEDFSEKQLNRGTVFFGVSTIATGIFATIGFVPFATSMGIVRMTGVATRKPFYLGSAAMVVLGIIGPVGLFFAAIPPSVGYGSLLVLFAVIVKQGVDNFKKAGLTERKGFALGIAMLTGTGIMMQPFEIFERLPAIVVPFVSNGLLVGVILAIVLEQALEERAPKAER
ncbi:MAG: purine/pyrimidine permease [Clostridiales Family XIII bacterium]|jgi:xanthine/uracil permease|nr:purine/pyrimidine permease [Clostridiales Family XIII bacterium]